MLTGQAGKDISKTFLLRDVLETLKCMEKSQLISFIQ